MTHERKVIERAREMAMATKVPETSNWKAIKNGAWDNGNYVQQYIPAAEAELIRRRTENTEAE